MQMVPDAVNLIYDPIGQLCVIALGGDPSEGLAMLDIQSSASLFSGQWVAYAGPNDFALVTIPSRYVALDPNGWAAGEEFCIGTINVETGKGVPVIEPRQTIETLIEDLLADGAYKTDGNLTKYGGPAGGYLHIVPEPTSLFLLTLGILHLLHTGCHSPKEATSCGKRCIKNERWCDV
jgi:hypothetical protein